jgi:hypothetical protein
VHACSLPPLLAWLPWAGLGVQLSPIGQQGGFACLPPQSVWRYYKEAQDSYQGLPHVYSHAELWTLIFIFYALTHNSDLQISLTPMRTPLLLLTLTIGTRALPLGSNLISGNWTLIRSLTNSCGLRRIVELLPLPTPYTYLRMSRPCLGPHLFTGTLVLSSSWHSAIRSCMHSCTQMLLTWPSTWRTLSWQLRRTQGHLSPLDLWLQQV